MPTPAPIVAPLHLIAPFGSAAASGCQQALGRLQLAHLPQLLQGMHGQPLLHGDALSYTPPHETAWALAAGWPPAAMQDGQLPLAAWLAQQQGLPGAAESAWGLLTLCHWQIGADAVVMAPPAELDVSPDEAAQLIAAMQPWLAEDGLALHPLPPDPQRPGAHWLVHGELLRGLRTASLDRASGRNVNLWLQRSQQDAAAQACAPLRRLQSEMQMLLYTHPVNEARLARGALPVNAFWISATGALPDAADMAAPAPRIQMLSELIQPALAENWPAWLAAWQQLDAAVFAPLLQRQRQQPAAPLTITLCGESHAQSWQSGKANWLTRLRQRLHPVALPATLKALSPCD